MKHLKFWPQNLEQWTLLYFVLPWPFFFFGNFRLPWAVQFLILFGYLVKRLWAYYARRRSAFTLPKLSGLTWYILILVLALWALLAGTDGYFFHQNGDYEKHNAMLRALTELPWPVSYAWPPGLDKYEEFRGTAYLIYYYGIYLLPAAVGKILGMMVARVLFSLEILAGIFLAFVWFLRFCEKFKWWLPLIFIFASGLDILGKLFTKNINLMDGVGHLEWWTDYVFWSYQSQTTLLFWVPQHCISGWILAAALFDMYWSQRKEPASPRDAGLEDVRLALPATTPGAGPAIERPRPWTWLLLMTMWSPFAVLGSAPLALIIVLRQLRPANRGGPWGWFPAIWKSIDWAEIGCCVLGLIPVLVFLSGDIATKPNQPFWKVHNPYEYWPKYLAFCFCEFGVLAYFMLPLIKKYMAQSYYRFTLLVVGMLCLFPWYYFGPYNDFTMRSSIPWLFLLWVMLAKVLLLPARDVTYWPKRHLVLLFLVGAITPLSEMSRAVRDRGNRMPYLSVLHIRLNVAAQYLGYERSLYGRLFAKRFLPRFRLSEQIIEQWSKDYIKLRLND